MIIVTMMDETRTDDLSSIIDLAEAVPKISSIIHSISLSLFSLPLFTLLVKERKERVFKKERRLNGLFNDIIYVAYYTYKRERERGCILNLDLKSKS